MNIILIVILLALCYVLLTNQIVENIEDLNRYSNINENNECCLISKKLGDDIQFHYHYQIKNNCDRTFNNNYRCVHKNELVDDKPYDISTCGKTTEFGSCRINGGFECMDFMTENDCKKYKMKWSKETCNKKLPVDIVYPDYTMVIGSETITR